MDFVEGVVSFHTLCGAIVAAEICSESCVITFVPVLSICPLHINSGYGKERRILIGPW